MIDLVLQLQTIGRDRDQWLVQIRGARERVRPLTDDDLRQAAHRMTPAGGSSLLPPEVDTWDGLLAHLRPNDVWLPNARVLEMVGRLIHDHLICGRIADYVRTFEARARAERVAMRYVVNVFEGEEDGLLPRLPFELIHRDAFWFRRAGTVGVRLSPDSTPRDVQLQRGASVLIATAHMDGRDPSAAQLAEHAEHIADAVRRAGMFPVTIPDCTAAMLEKALHDSHDLVYVICHGTEDLDRHGRLSLRGGDITGRQLGEWLEATADTGNERVQAAILCACWSAVPGDRPGTMGMAAHLASGERRAVAALGFRAPVDVRWGLAFMKHVFECLSDNPSLEMAVSSARRSQPEDDPAWSLPLLFAPERDPFPHAASLESGVRGARNLESGSPILSLLPAPPRPYFTARSPQLETLRTWLKTPGAAVLTALAGEGGVGKTEIARKIAHDTHETGTPVLWLERPDREIGASLTAMIRQLLPEYRPPDNATIDGLHVAMTRELSPHRGLLILDDVEQASAVDTLTPGPRWNVLVTTRQRSLLPSVVEVDVEPLESDDAMKLLAKVAQDGEAFSPNDMPAARDLVVALGGLPLAIELAGELIRRGASLDEIRQTTQSSDTFADESLTARVARVMDRSLASLAPGDEAAWALVAALPTAGATEQDVALGLDEPEARASRRLFRLRQASLLRFQPAQARYTMHPLARQIARSRARSGGSWDDTLATAAKVMQAAAAWCIEPVGRDTSEAFRRWRTQRDFLDSLDLRNWPPEARGADEIAKALCFAEAFRKFERLPEDRAVLLDAAIVRATNRMTLAQSHELRGDLRRRRDDLEGADDDYAHALALYAGEHNHRGLANVYQLRGDLRLRRDPDSAEADYARALDLYMQIQDSLGLANVHQARGDLRLRRNDLDGAEKDYARAFDLYTKVQHSVGLAYVYRSRGVLRRVCGDDVGAEQDLAYALDLFDAVRDHLGLASTYHARGDVRRVRGDVENAEADYNRADKLYAETQDRLGLATVSMAHGDLCAEAGALDRAESFFLQALQLYERAQESLGMSNALTELAKSRAQLGDRAGSRTYATRALPLAQASYNLYAQEMITHILAWANDATQQHFPLNESPC